MKLITLCAIALIALSACGKKTPLRDPNEKPKASITAEMHNNIFTSI